MPLDCGYRGEVAMMQRRPDPRPREAYVQQAATTRKSEGEASPMYTTCLDSDMSGHNKARQTHCDRLGDPSQTAQSGAACLPHMYQTYYCECRRWSTLTPLVVNNLGSTGLSMTLSTSSALSTASSCKKEPWYQYNIVTCCSSVRVCIPCG